MLVRKFIAIVSLIITAVVGLCPISPALATAYQNNQDINQTALLTASEPSFKIKVYPQPNTLKQQIGYGLSGDEVTILQQTGSNDGQLWDFVRFNNSAQTKGWVSDIYISPVSQIQESITIPSSQKADFYLGNQEPKRQQVQKSTQHTQYKQNENYENYEQRNVKQYNQSFQHQRDNSNPYNQR